MAKMIWYSWGTGEAARLQYGIDLLALNAIAIKVEEIFSSFRNGMGDCMEAIDKDEEWVESFETKSTKFFEKMTHKV
ncbi:MAG: hypothetical protein ABI851_16430 [Saprospiraceae bacterium]